MGLRCYTLALPSCGRRGLLFTVYLGLSGGTAQAPGTWVSVAATLAQELWHMSLIAPWHVDGIVPNQGSNPCLQHWQTDS